MKTRLIKLTSILIAIIIAVLSLSVSAFANTVATVSAENITNVKQGQTITVPISISNNPGVLGFSISFDYDASILTPVSVTKGGLLNGLFDNSIETSDAGSFDVVWSGTENMTQNGVLFNVTFNVIGKAENSTTVNISYSQADTFNEDWQDVVLNCKPFEITFAGNQATDVPTLTVGSIKTPANRSVIIPIELNENSSITEANINLSYNSNYLTPITINGDNYTVTSSNINSAKGTLTFKISSASPKAGTAVNIKFFVNNDADGKYTLTATSSIKCIDGYIDVYTDNNTAYVFAESVEALPGTTVNIPVNISKNSGIMGYKLSFAYDKSVLTPISVTAGSDFSGNFNDSIGITDGYFDVVWNDLSNNLSNGELMTVSFKVNDTAKTGKTNISVSYSPEDTFNEEWDNIKLICSDFSVDVKNIIISNKPDDDISVGESVQLNATNNLSDGAEGITWTSSDESVAVVDSTGKVTAVGEGIVTITATDKNGAESFEISIIKTEYTVKWIVDETVTETKVRVGSAITAPKAPTKEGYTFKGWTPSIPDTMPKQDLTFTAIFEKISVPEIPKPIAIEIVSAPSTVSYNYKANVSLAGLKVVAKYADSEPVDITNQVDVKNFDTKKVGNKTATVKYGDLSATFNYSVSYAWWQWIIRILLLGFLWY